MSAEVSLGEQSAFYDQRWSGFTYANRLKLARAVAILQALAATKLLEPEIIDLGSGTGWLSGIVGNFGPTTAVDISAEAIERAALKYPYVKFLHADILSWHYPRNSFDVVISQEILEHMEDQKAYLDIAHGLLRKDGYLILTTPNARTMYAMSDKRRRKWANQPIENWLTAKDLKRLLVNNFEIIHLETIVFNFAVKGLYRVADSQRLRSVLTLMGLSRAFDSLRGSLGFGLHFVVLAKKK